MPKGNAKETEERIFTTAIRLFNERGYDGVSLRDIAREAGTTIGNMTYHFSKKEDLLMRIVEDLYQEFGTTQQIGSPGDPLSALLDSLLAAEANREAYPFYYRHINQVVGGSEALLAKAKDFQTWLYREYGTCLRNLRDAGLVRQDIDDDGLDLLSMLIVSVAASWALPVSPGCNEALPSINMVRAVEGALVPYLTALGVEALRDRADKNGESIPGIAN